MVFASNSGIGFDRNQETQMMFTVPELLMFPLIRRQSPENHVYRKVSGMIAESVD